MGTKVRHVVLFWKKSNICSIDRLCECGAHMTSYYMSWRFYQCSKFTRKACMRLWMEMAPFAHLADELEHIVFIPLSSSSCVKRKTPAIVLKIGFELAIFWWDIFNCLSICKKEDRVVHRWFICDLSHLKEKSIDIGSGKAEPFFLSI